MNIGLFFFSMTGNTLSVAEKLSEKLQEKGHETTLCRLKTLPENAKPGDSVQLGEMPSLEGFDAYVFASPVMAFHLPPITKDFLEKAGMTAGHKAVCFVTEHLPFAWMGGRQSIRTMKKICQNRQVVVLDTGVINWSRKDRPDRIDRLVERLADCF